MSFRYPGQSDHLILHEVASNLLPRIELLLV